MEQVGDQVDFYMLREPQSNQQMDWNCKIEILWRPELAHIQELNAMHAYKQKSKRFVADKIVETVPKETLAVQLSEELFERDYTKIWEAIQNFRKENGQKPRRRRRRKTKNRRKAGRNRKRICRQMSEKRMTLSEIGGIIVPDTGKEKEQGCDYEDSSICDRMER